jgi:hypothetical protein
MRLTAVRLIKDRIKRKHLFQLKFEDNSVYSLAFDGQISKRKLVRELRIFANYLETEENDSLPSPGRVRSENTSNIA